MSRKDWDCKDCGRELPMDSNRGRIYCAECAYQRRKKHMNAMNMHRRMIPKYIMLQRIIKDNFKIMQSMNVTDNGCEAPDP